MSPRTTMHILPIPHRKHPYWNYKRVSTAEKICIDEDDTVFQRIIKEMSEYIRKEPIEEIFWILMSILVYENPQRCIKV
jgi:hypothetical protein